MRLLLTRCFPLLLCSWLAGCDFDEASQEPDSSEPSELARDMLTAHNQVRASASPAPVPALPALAWSTEVAKTAQAWADQCKFEHNSKRGNFGENIAAATQGGLSNTGVVTNWAAEATSYDYGLNACAPGKQCGHYTQIVWRNTTHVGCAMKLCDKNSPFQGFTRWEFWVCNYSPPGNFVGQRPY